MRYARALRLGAILASFATATAILAAAAGAGQAFHDTFHDEETVLFPNFCGVQGMRVEVKIVRDGRVQAVPHGRDRLPHFSFHVDQTEVATNLATGKSVTVVTRVNDRDLKVTDNGDGTLTVLVLATGNSVAYGADGKAIARNPGQVRFEILIDHGGTPSDPSDDEEIAFLGVVKESTGRTDDLCAAAVPALS